MPTYAQLQSEPWWNRETVTAEMDWLGGQLCAALGVPRGNFGCKGDNQHLNGGHRSQEWILNSRYCTNRTYATEPGLTGKQMRHLAAFDVTPGSREQMLTISRNLDRATRAGQLEELVEWFGNTNNDTRVDGWNNIRNAVASSDPSHLWHVHGRFSRKVLRDMGVMRRTLAALLGTTPTTQGVDDMADALERAWMENGQNYPKAIVLWEDQTEPISDSAASTTDRPVVNQFKKRFEAVAADVAAIKERPAAELTMTPADREAVVAGIVGGLVTNTAFLGAVAKAVADENARRQQA